MDDVVARCPDCGTEQNEAFAHCFVCLTASRWWCRACQGWLAARACAACGGGVNVPSELALGPCTIGTTVAFKVTARNPGRKLVSCTVASPDPGVAITNPRLLVPAGGSMDVRGGITLPPGVLGPRTFRLLFNAPVPAETRLVVEALAPVPRLEFFPEAVVLSATHPGGSVRTTVAVKNTGNVSLSARLTGSEPWLAVDPPRVELAPSEVTTVRFSARTRRTDFGAREGFVRAESIRGTWEARVRLVMPDPQLAADPIAFGELRPGRPVFADVVVRNTGRVRVECSLAAADPWLQVRPLRINLPAGRQKKVRVRALITPAQDGPQRCELVVSGPCGVVLRVPVTATGKVPKPVLRPIRKQRVRDVIGPPVERKFQVANDGDGRLVCTATADQPWVRIITPDLKVAPGKKRKLRYVLDLPVLPRGEHRATITLASNGGTGAVPVTVQVLDPNPVLEVLPAPVLGAVSPELPLSAFLQVRNGGVGLLTVRAECENPQVIVAPAEAPVPTGPPVRFNLTIPVAGLPGGEHEVAVRFTSNAGSDRAVFRFRLPVERIDALEVVTLGDRPAGRATGGAVRVRNTGPDRVVLGVRGQHQWVRPGCERIALEPGETVSVPFRVELAPGMLGPVASAILLEGRSLWQAVAVRAVARKVDLVVVPGVVLLGALAPGEERAFTVDVVNAGEIAVDVPELHAPGDLEVWVRRATVRPGERVTFAGRVRVNTRQTGAPVRTAIALAEGATVRCVAQVVAPLLPRVLAATAAAGGLIGGSVLAAAVGWWLGAPLALLGLVTGAWIFWRQFQNDE
jgi:hypothetical protein